MDKYELARLAGQITAWTIFGLIMYWLTKSKWAKRKAEEAIEH